MAETPTLEELTRGVAEKIQALTGEGGLLNDETLETKVRSYFDDLLSSDEVVEQMRKIKFSREDKLVGTKYARAGLTVGDVEFLHQYLSAARAVGKSSGPSEQLEKTVQAISEGRYVDVAVTRTADYDHIGEMFESGQIDQAGFHRAMRAMTGRYDIPATGGFQSVDSWDNIARAMDTAESGFGQQLVGAQYVNELWAGARAQSRIFGLMNTFQMTAPTAYLPVEADLPELLYVTESTANNSSNYDTVKTGSNRVQVDAAKFVMHQMWSGELEEDSLIPFVPFIRAQAARSLAHYSDSLVLNGDTTNAATGNINLDDADPADTKHYLAFDGIRHAYLVDNTGNEVVQGGAITYAALTGLRSLGIDATYLHDWGHPVNPADFVYVADPETADEIGDLDEVQTVDKYGSNATVLTGEVGNIGRNPLIASLAQSKTETDGKVSTTGANNTEGAVTAFNRNGFVVGERRSVQVEVERLPATDQTRIVHSLRMGLGRFSPTGAASGIEAAAGIRDITLS